MRTIGVAVAAVLACLALVGAACSSFDAASSPDEAGSEAAPPDGSTVGDGGGPGCMPDAHTFCDDFETDPLKDTRWTLPTVVAPGGLVQSTEQAHSGTHSALITIAPGATTNGKAFLSKTFGFPVKSIACELWFYGETLAPGTQDEAALMTYEVRSAPGSAFAELFTRINVASDGSQVIVRETQDGGVVVSGPAVGGAALDHAHWTQVRLEMSLLTGDVELKVDGNISVTTRATPPPAVNGGFTLNLGVNDTPKTSRYFVDDITCDVVR